MKKIISSILLCGSILLSTNLLCQSQENAEKYSKVKITIQDKSDIKVIQSLGFDLEGAKLSEQSLEIILSEREILDLKESGLSFEILIDDMTKYYQERSRRTETEMKNLETEMKQKYSSGGFGFGSMGGFYTYNEVVAELDTMRMLYPNLITAKYSIGSTIEGRTIWAVKISDNPDVTEGEPEVFYNALIHAREPEAMMIVIYFMYYLLENYGSDPELTYLVNNRELYFVPVINVDGYEYNHQMAPNGGYMWRKNKRDNNGNSTFEEAYDGVDLNRNFGYMWGYNNIGSSPNPPDEAYRGSSPFSEPETQVIRDLCNSRNFKLAINFHTYGNLLLYPWDYINSPTPDNDWFVHCSSDMVTFNGYEAGQAPLVLYELNGGANDWMYGEQTSKPKIFSYLPEVGNDNDGFWPPPERIFPLAEENVYLNKVLAWGPGVIDNPPHILSAEVFPSYGKPMEDSIHISATELNPDNYNSIVTAYLYDTEDNLVDEFELNEVSTNSFYSSRLVPQEENFYHLLLKDSGVQIPSNFYYQKDLKFTTAGPVVLDSVYWTQLSTFFYSVKPFIKNLSTVTTITNASVRLICNDPWVVSINPTTRTLPNIPPGSIVSPSTGFTVRVDTSIFPDYFNFKVEVMSDGWPYWADSMRVPPIVTVDEELPQPLVFQLKQNYPNPFNPNTKISWQSPVGSQQTLMIYDVLGNEVAILLDEYKPAGKYETEFNAASLPSGVYFYQLKAGSFIETKKMILLK
jgi:hypothetical protein